VTDLSKVTGDCGLAEKFERNRTHLRALAYRLLGSQADADDDRTRDRFRQV
jgi:DNA-directed RNA polymerase specialized sigma24 family protein